MKQSFLLELPNGPFGDPLIVLRLRWLPRVLLLDAGDTGCLGPRTLLETTDVLISHCHMDHVFGLGRLLRLRLGRKEQPLRLFGPAGLRHRIIAHLRSYEWNLVDAYPIDLSIFEVHPDHTELWRFPVEHGFDPELVTRGAAPDEEPVFSDDLLSIEARLFDHGSTTSAAWRVREHRSYHVDTTHLERLGHEPGPWLARIKSAFRRNPDSETLVCLPDGTQMPLAELGDSLIRICDGDCLVYATDISPSEENLSRLAFFATGARRLAIETHFSNEHLDLAREHGHLTATLAGKVARQAGVHAVCPFHFSPRYEKDGERLFSELKKTASPVSIEDLPLGPQPSAG